MKNIVVITGSPLKNGNSEKMANAFIRGAGRKGHKLTTISAAELDIQGCHACEGCYKTGNPCVYADDFNHIAPVLLEADVIVFATPLYWFTFPEQIKAVIDRFYALLRGEFPFKGTKECMLLVCGADKKEAFAGIVKTYEIMADYLEWNDRGHVIAENASEKGDVDKTGILEEIQRLGEEI